MFISRQARLNEATGHAIRCEASQSLLFLNRNIGSPPNGHRFLSTKAFAGLVARRSDDNALYSASLLILSTPNAGESAASLSAYRPNGTLVLVVTASPQDKGVAFELRGVARRGAFAVHIEGMLAGSDITLHTARVGQLLHDVGRPQRQAIERRRSLTSR